MANCSELNIVEQEMKKNALTCWIQNLKKTEKHIKKLIVYFFGVWKVELEIAEKN